MTNAYMQEGLDAFKSGQVAMQMNFFAFWPGSTRPQRRRRQDRVLRQPAGRSTSPSSAARESRCFLFAESRRGAGYLKWFAKPDVQKKWWALGGYSCHKAVLNDPGFPKSAPFAQDFLTSMAS